MKKIKQAFAFILVLFMISCEKDITVDLPKPDPKIVVEGYIEPGQPIKVFLSRNAPYFAPVDSASLSQYQVKGATVEVSDGTTTVKLLELSLLGFNMYIYNDISFPKAGKTYKLTVKTGTESVYGYTYIPIPVKLDSVKYRVFGDRDSFGLLNCHLKDPDTLGNYYRFLSKRLNKDNTDFIINAPLTFSTVFDDKIVNGKSFDFDLERGDLPGEHDQKGEEGGLFKRGDTIVLKWSTIDKASFDFWRSLERSQGSSGNPFSSPINIKSNIIGGLGGWTGYGASYDTVIAK